MDYGSFIIRNTSGTEYSIAELGGVALANDATRDLLDAGEGVHYKSYEAVVRLTTVSTGAQLYRDILAGDITIVSQRQPRPVLEF